MLTSSSTGHNIITRLSLIGTDQARSLFIENLATLLSSGMEISAAVAGAIADTNSKALEQKLQEIKISVESGTTLSAALEHSNLFSGYIISLVKNGEQSGQLSQNLVSIAKQQVKDQTLKSKIHSAMLYPCIVFGVTIIVGLGVAWFILPRLIQVFSSVDLELPLITRILIFFGNTLQHYGIYIVPGVFFLTLALAYALAYSSRIKSLSQSILLVTPGAGQLIRSAELSRFGSIFGSLLDAGIPIVEAMRLLAQSTQIKQFSILYATMATALENGDSFQNIFSRKSNHKKLVPSSVQQLIIAGEGSGQLATSLLHIGTVYESKTEQTAKNLTILLEPILLVMVWLGVVLVALAIILPIYRLVGGLNT